RHARDLDHSNDVAVLLAEERHGATIDRLPVAHPADADVRIRPDRLVDQPLDLGTLILRERTGVREVEPQTIRRNQRTLLEDVLAEDPSQRRVQQVGRRVVTLRIPTSRRLDLGVDGARREIALDGSDDRAASADLPDLANAEAPP